MLIKFAMTVGGKLNNLSIAGCPHNKLQVLTGNLLPWASRQACVVALKRNISFIFVLPAVNKTQQFSADMAEEYLGMGPQERELVGSN